MIRPLALATLLLAAQNLPCLAANPPAAASATYARAQQRRYMPKWVYYDRLGLAAWNKGERPTAKTHWEYAMSLCENDLRGRPKGALDKQTKIWINDLITHMTFLMSYYEQPTPQALRNLTASEAMIKLKEAVVEDIDRKLQWFDKLESFAKMLVGRETYLVQDFRMLRAKQLMMQEQYRREIANIKGVPYVQKGGNGDGYNYVIQDGRAVKKPAWWKAGEEIPSWRRDTLKVGTQASNSSSKAGKPTTGTSGIGSMGRPGWWDKGDKPEVPGVSYVGGKQIKHDKVGADGTIWNPAKGDSSTQWGQNPNSENSRPNKWGTQAERDPALDLNAKQKPPNWGENSQPRDTTTTGWGNSGSASNQPKNPNGAGEVNTQPGTGGDYWK